MFARPRAVVASLALFGFSVAMSCLAYASKGDATSTLGPLNALESNFPHMITLMDHGRLVEFCPDNTCDGFLAPPGVATSQISDFAYLYEFFFSQYVYLRAWRSTAEAKAAAEEVLSKPEYRSCKKKTQRDEARCVLLRLSRAEKIKLIFVRYDEGARNVVPEEITKEVSR